MAHARWNHAATLLPTGQVLVVGGYDFGDTLASAELYDPATGLWTETGSMADERRLHTTTLLPNGQVLVAGGFSNVSGALTSAELYDPATGLWTETGSMATGRGLHTATLLPNGQVLVAGGDGDTGVLTSAELYDPASGTWTETGDLVNARFVHTATLLPNGKVLAAGGQSCCDSLASAELYVSEGGGELTLVSAASRKTHGIKGDFDINLPLTGEVGIECRSGLTRYTTVFTFNQEVSGADSAASSCGTVSSIRVDSANARNLLVSFNGATCNAQTVTVTLTNVHANLGNTLASASASVGILVADVLGDGHVGNGDIGNVQGHLGQRTDSSNFRDDVTVDGRINIQDVQTVRSHRGESLP